MTAAPIIREVTIGGCRLIQGDCLQVLPREAYAQPDMFIERPAPAKQEAMDI